MIRCTVHFLAVATMVTLFVTASAILVVIILNEVSM